MLHECRVTSRDRALDTQSHVKISNVIFMFHNLKHIGLRVTVLGTARAGRVCYSSSSSLTSLSDPSVVTPLIVLSTALDTASRMHEQSRLPTTAQVLV